MMNKTKSGAAELIALVVFVSATLAVWAILIWGAVVDRGGGRDLFWGVLAESLVIIWALFTIDRLKEWYNARQGLPARCLLYISMLELIDEFLAEITPPGLRKVSRRNYRYKYGDIPAIPVLEAPHPEELPRLLAGMQEEFKSQPRLGAQPFFKLRAQLDTFLDRGLSLLEPEPATLLLRLAITLRTASKAIDQMAIEDAANAARGIVIAAIDVRECLERILQKHFKAEDGS